jgi:hypothetical protein
MRNLALMWVLAGCLLGCGGSRDVKDKATPAADTTDTAAVETDTTATEKAYVKQGLLRDTLIALSADWAIHFSGYNEKLELWYNPRIVNLNKKDTMTIKEYPYESGSELFIEVSPNFKFFVLDYVNKWEMTDEEKRELELENGVILGYDRQFCLIIDIKNANSVWQMQSDCGGKWDNESNWISGDEIIFTSD